MTNDDVIKILAGNVELVLALYCISLVLCDTASFSYIITVELISPGLYMMKVMNSRFTPCFTNKYS